MCVGGGGGIWEGGRLRATKLPGRDVYWGFLAHQPELLWEKKKGGGWRLKKKRYLAFLTFPQQTPPGSNRLPKINTTEGAGSICGQWALPGGPRALPGFECGAGLSQRQKSRPSTGLGRLQVRLQTLRLTSPRSAALHSAVKEADRELGVQKPRQEDSGFSTTCGHQQPPSHQTPEGLSCSYSVWPAESDKYTKKPSKIDRILNSPKMWRNLYFHNDLDLKTFINVGFMLRDTCFVSKYRNYAESVRFFTSNIYFTSIMQDFLCRYKPDFFFYTQDWAARWKGIKSAIFYSDLNWKWSNEDICKVKKLRDWLTKFEKKCKPSGWPEEADLSPPGLYLSWGMSPLKQTG